MAEETKGQKAAQKDEKATRAKAADQTPVQTQAAERRVREPAAPTPTPEPLPEDVTPTEEALVAIPSYEAQTLVAAGSPMTARERALAAPRQGTMPRVDQLDEAGIRSELERWTLGELRIENKRVGQLLFRLANLLAESDPLQGARARSVLGNPIGGERFIRDVRQVLGLVEA